MLFEANSLYEQGLRQETVYVEAALYPIIPTSNFFLTGFIFVGRYRSAVDQDFQSILEKIESTEKDEISDIFQAIKKAKMLFEKYVIVATCSSQFANIR